MEWLLWPHETNGPKEIEQQGLCLFSKWGWFTEAERDLQEMAITYEDTQEHDSLKKILGGVHQNLQEKPKMGIGKMWTKERKETHRERMQE